MDILMGFMLSLFHFGFDILYAFAIKYLSLYKRLKNHPVFLETTLLIKSYKASLSPIFCFLAITEANTLGLSSTFLAFIFASKG